MHIKARHQINFCLIIVFALFFALLSCPNSARVEAASTQNTRNTASSISIAASPSVDLEISPSAEGSFSQKTTELTISTSNTSGFRILVNSTDTSNLVNNHHDKVIPTISHPSTLANMPLNSWGIYLGTTNPDSSSVFSPLSTTPTELINNNLANASDIYKLSAGVKADTTLPAGTYYNTLVISVVAKPPIVFSGITYMQDMTPEICALANENDTMQLIDKRDNKSYWVAKLKDGNCWMVQNLGLDLTTSKTLTSTDTDLPNGATYTPSYNILGSNFNVGTAYTNQYSWNLGTIVIATPLETKSCNNYAGDGNVSLISGDQLQTKCAYQGFIDVSGDDWRPTFTAQDGTFYYPNNTTYSGLVAVDQKNKTYDAHYLVGNYYQFNAATAGTGNAVQSNGAQAKGTICPQKWTLPISGSSNYSTSGSFSYLLSKYGLMVDSSTPGPVENGEYNVVTKPLYFVRSGMIYPGGNSLKFAGNMAILNSKTGAEAVWSNYILRIYTSTVYPYTSDNRSYGHNVRCVMVAS